MILLVSHVEVFYLWGMFQNLGESLYGVATDGEGVYRNMQKGQL